MEPLEIGILTIGLFMLLMVLGVKIAFAGMLSGLLGVWLLSGWSAVIGRAGQYPFFNIASYNIVVVPLFILMGFFAFHTGITEELFDASRKWVGSISGGMPIATLLACTGFAACTGSSTAAVALMSKVALPEMLKDGVQKRLASAVVAASATLASLIPPSVTIVIYGIITGESVSKLLMAGFIPGIISAIIYLGMIYFRCLLVPSLAPTKHRAPLKEKLRSLKGLYGMITIVIVVLVGLYAGFFTPSEAGAVGATAVFLLALLRRKMTWQRLKESLKGTAEVTFMVFMLLIGIGLLNYVVALSGVNTLLIDAIMTLSHVRYVALVGLFLIYILFGMFIGPLGMMILLVPATLPAILALGFDPLWFGIIVVKLCEIGMISPPVGINVFVVSGVHPDIPMIEIYKGCFPFLAMDILTIALFIVFPQIITFLPSTM